MQPAPITLPRFRWRSASPNAAAAAALAARFNLPLAVAGVLCERGLAAPDDAAAFLKPSLQQLGDPFAFPGIMPAVERLWTAISQGEAVTVFGDFDVDGVTAAALLTDAIRALGGRAAAFLPDRLSEGYGLTRAALERCLREQAPRLLITVDCGITAADEVAWTNAAGVDVIVTDHHEASAALPEAALARVNPRLGATPGAEHLCGAGVAFKLVHALLKHGRQAGRAASAAYDARLWLDAVAVATVADVVPLLGENRVLVAAGLATLSRRPRPGLRALMHRAGVKPPITSHHLAFLLGPRLNAAGRMRGAWPALRLLDAADHDAAACLAAELEALNAERRSVEADLLALASAALTQAPPSGAVVVSGRDWHIGTLGIVAARLAEQWGLPAAVISLDAAGDGRGSARGLRGDNVVAALDACRAWLGNFGGHQRAAGFHLKAGALAEFRAAFGAACAAQRAAGDTRPEALVDGWLTPEDWTAELWRALQRLEPFGEGHARPLWGMRGLTLAERPAPVGGNGEHLRLALRAANGAILRGVWFRHGALAAGVAAAGRGALDALFELHENNFGGQTTLEMRVVDLRPAAPE
jgi:single-stranded-DNA-specific exonuclease